jgi:hypothetical protein
MTSSEGSGRYDHLHGDEPEIEAGRAERQRGKDAWAEDHWEDHDWRQGDDV